MKFFRLHITNGYVMRISRSGPNMHLVQIFMPPSMPPSKKEGHIALHMSVSLNLVQLITQECFALEASNLVGR